jgi:hypothetical protein
VLPQNDRQKISERAYDLWKRDGCPHGKDVDHWLQAEQEADEQARAEARPKAPSVAAKPEIVAPAPVKKVRAVAKSAPAPKEDEAIQSAPKPRGKGRK